MSFCNPQQIHIGFPVFGMKIIGKQTCIYRNGNNSERTVLKIKDIHSNEFCDTACNFLRPMRVKTELDVITPRFKFSSKFFIDSGFWKKFFYFVEKSLTVNIFANSSSAQIVSRRAQSESPRLCFDCLIEVAQLLIFQCIFKKLRGKIGTDIKTESFRKRSDHAVIRTAYDAINIQYFGCCSYSSCRYLEMRRLSQRTVFIPNFKIFSIFGLVIPVTRKRGFFRKNVADSYRQSAIRTDKPVDRFSVFLNIAIFFKSFSQKIYDCFAFETVNPTVCCSHTEHFFLTTTRSR